MRLPAMGTMLPKAVAVVAAVGAGSALLGIESRTVAAQTSEGCDPSTLFQPVALQRGDTLRVSVINDIPPTEGNKPAWKVFARDADGKVVQATEITAPPGGIATTTIPPTEWPIPPIEVADLWVEVSLVTENAEDCTIPAAGIQAFDKNGNTSFVLNQIPPTALREIPPQQPGETETDGTEVRETPTPTETDETEVPETPTPTETDGTEVPPTPTDSP